MAPGLSMGLLLIEALSWSPVGIPQTLIARPCLGAVLPIWSQNPGWLQDPPLNGSPNPVSASPHDT